MQEERETSEKEEEYRTAFYARRERWQEEEPKLYKRNKVGEIIQYKITVYWILKVQQKKDPLGDLWLTLWDNCRRAQLNTTSLVAAT